MNSRTNTGSPCHLLTRRTAYLIGSFALQFIYVAADARASVNALDYPGPGWFKLPVYAGAWMSHGCRSTFRQPGDGCFRPGRGYQERQKLFHWRQCRYGVRAAASIRPSQTGRML